MTTPRAALQLATESDGGPKGKLSDLARDGDPLRRLEAELQSADPGHADVERLYEKTWTLLEEAWGLMTDCLVLRDGLLDACREIEQTMDAVHNRLQSLSPAMPSIPRELAASERDLANAPIGVNGSNSSAEP
jgi:hypothetical protein